MARSLMPILIAASLLCAVGSRADESPPGNDVDDPHSSEPRVVAVDPERRKIVWQFPGAGGESFYSPARGMSQRLESGNTLIVVSHAGMAFEVTSSGETVWRYLSPPVGASRRRPTLVSLRRYSAEWRPPVALELRTRD